MGVDADVVGEVEGGRVDPQGPAQPALRPVEELPEARDQLESWLESLPDVVDPDAAIAAQPAWWGGRVWGPRQELLR